MPSLPAYELVRDLKLIWSRLGAREFSQAWAEGGATSMEQAIVHALKDEM